MLSADTNIFIYAADPDSPYQDDAIRIFETSASGDNEFVFCELVMVEVSKALWKWAKETKSVFGNIIDARLALTLRHHGVTRFATANVKHFQDFGFSEVWNPLLS